MGRFLNVGAVITFALVGLCVYWYLYPQEIPSVLRDNLPGLQVSEPRSPVGNFRPPRF
jgi:hypothetical protein